VRLAPQVGINDLWGQRKVGGVGPIHPFAPITLDRRHPPRSAISTILPTHRVNICATTEQIEEESDLIGRAGAHRHWGGRSSGQCRLITGGRTRLFLAQLKQTTQPRIVGTQGVKFTRETLDTVNDPFSLSISYSTPRMSSTASIMA
jgi:hypothetical protein